MRVDAVILARGGSKGIPKKNIIDFLGKPLLAWTIEQCIGAKSISNIWVSSDDQQILDVAREYGTKLIRRPDNISGDGADSESGWLHAVECIEQQSVKIDAVLAPQVTSPIRESIDIDLAIEKFRVESLDSLFSASIVDDLYFWEKSDDGVMGSINYDYKKRKRRQDFPQQIIENGSFYLFKPDVLKSENNRLGGKIGCFEMEFWKMFEIDEINDMRICSALMAEFIMPGDRDND